MTADELLNKFMLALCVYREARGESPLGKAYVAQVVINRATDIRKRWPRTVTAVILQPSQFSSFNKSDPNVGVYPLPADPSWVECVSAVERVLMALKPLTFANHYHITSVKPPWSDPDKVVAREGSHVFLEL